MTEISTKLAIFYNEKTIITIHRMPISFLGMFVAPHQMHIRHLLE